MFDLHMPELDAEYGETSTSNTYLFPPCLGITLKGVYEVLCERNADMLQPGCAFALPSELRLVDRPDAAGREALLGELEQGQVVGWIVSGPETVQGHVMHKYAYFGRFRRLS